MEIVEYHKTRKSLDFNYINRVFEAQEREFLEAAQKEHPNSIIRNPHSGLIASGAMVGIGGSSPKEWDGTIYDWNGKRIK